MSTHGSTNCQDTDIIVIGRAHFHPIALLDILDVVAGEQTTLACPRIDTTPPFIAREFNMLDPVAL